MKVAIQRRKRARDLQLLVGGNDLTEDGLHASPDGRLFLWTGETRVVPREVSFEEAREWWTKFQSHVPYLAAPFFTEGTAAERIVSLVCEAIQAHEQPARHNAAQPVIAHGFFDMESAVNVRDLIDRLRSTMNKSVTLLNLFANDLADIQDAAAYREALAKGKRPAAAETRALEFVVENNDMTEPGQLRHAARSLQAQAQSFRLAAKLAERFGGTLQSLKEYRALKGGAR